MTECLTKLVLPWNDTDVRVEVPMNLIITYQDQPIDEIIEENKRLRKEVKRLNKLKDEWHEGGYQKGVAEERARQDALFKEKYGIPFVNPHPESTAVKLSSIQTSPAVAVHHASMHAPWCDFHADQYLWECTCGIKDGKHIHRTEIQPGDTVRKKGGSPFASGHHQVTVKTIEGQLARMDNGYLVPIAVLERVV